MPPAPRGVVVRRSRDIDIVARERFVIVRVIPRPAAPSSLLSVCPCGAPSRVLSPGVFAGSVPRIAPHTNTEGDLCGFRYKPVPAGLRGNAS